MYSGFMDDGNYVEWPITENCMSDSGFDPRFRPWFANAATGPKDVIILIDVSGSMDTADRITLAKKAAKKVLFTLTEYDYASVVDFSSIASAWSETLKPMTDANKDPTDVNSIYS